MTVQPQVYAVLDPLVRLPPPDDYTIYRTPIWLPPKSYHSQSHATGFGGVLEQRKRHTFSALYHALKKILWLIPDIEIGWLPFATATAWRAHRRQPADVLFTTSYPYTAHLVGLLLKATLRLPWVADFRDPWAEYAYLYPRHPSQRHVARFLEALTIRYADRVIANTEAARQRFITRYPDFAAKFVTLPQWL